MNPRYYLCSVWGDQGPARFIVNEQAQTIGRSDRAQIVLREPTIRAEEDDGTCVIEIIDEGMGHEEEVLFQAFHLADDDLPPAAARFWEARRVVLLLGGATVGQHPGEPRDRGAHRAAGRALVR
jgi:hypothetical protein